MTGVAEVERWYREHGDVVLRRATSILGDRQEAMDVLQDLFADLISRPGRFLGQSSPTTFLYAATTHRALRRLRDRKNRARILDEKLAPELPRSRASSAEDLATLRHVLARVPQRLAAPALYFHIDGMSHEEIAALLGCSRRQVGTLLERFAEKTQRLIHKDAPRRVAEVS